MVLVNVLVAEKENSKVLLGWEILRSSLPDASFETLFHHKLLSRIPSTSTSGDTVIKLESCFIGKEKHCLDKTDISLPIEECVATFGPYVKFVVTVASACPSVQFHHLLQVVLGWLI